jgi:hypothetical protein
MAVNNLNTPGVGIQPSLIDAKGDLLVGTADDAIDRLGVTGTTGAVLTADAGETTGLKWAAAGSVGGLVHIETANPSAVSSQSFDDVFSSTYDHYKLIGYLTLSLESYLLGRVRVSGTDNTSNNYKWAHFYQRFVGSNSVVGANSNALTSSFRFAGLSSNDSYFEATLFNPFATKITAFDSRSIDSISSTDGFRYDFAGATTVNTSYTGFSLFVPSGTMTGTISLFGVKK